MRYVVDAICMDGCPRLRVLDADTGDVRLEWNLTRVARKGRQGLAAWPATTAATMQSLQHNWATRLISRLFLVACAEQLAKLPQE
jgi:hypothetical protein